MRATLTCPKRSLLILLAALVPLTACNPPEVLRSEAADRIASPAWMIKRPINSAPFSLTAYERMHERHEPGNIYIGSFDVQTNEKNTKISNPTPINPVALHLASKDNAHNLAYLAGPCQFSGDFPNLVQQALEEPSQAPAGCTAEYWDNTNIDAQMLESYQNAVNDIVARYDIEGINLIGYGKGAAIAAALAATRDDVLSMRTVAGDFTALDTPQYASALNQLPQHHFIGGRDTVVPSIVLHEYLNEVGPSECIKYTLIEDAEHDRGWVDQWPQLLKQLPPVCEKKAEPLPPPMDLPEPIFYPRDYGDVK